MNGLFLTQQAERTIDWRDYALELIDEGNLNARDLAIMLVKYMSVYDVEDCLKCNEMDPRSLYEEERLNEFLTRNA